MLLSQQPSQVQPASTESGELFNVYTPPTIPLDLLAPCCQDTALEDKFNVMLLVKEELFQFTQG